MIVSRVIRSLVLALAVSATLSGCMSLAGSQPRFIDVTRQNAGVPGYAVADTLIRFAAPDDAVRDHRTPQQYRDDVVRLYLLAIESVYSDFKMRVSSERRELGLGIDLVTLGLTNYASVARTSIVNDLSAAAAGFGSARGAIDRNVYFDRALTALLASMDAQRARIKTRIAENLLRTPAAYPLSAAFEDLSLLESAGSLDRALADVTGSAQQDRQQAERDYSNAVRACESDGDLTVNRRRIMRYVINNQADASKVLALAQLMGVTTTGIETNVVALRGGIQNELIANYCTNQKLAQLIADMEARSMDVPD
jgi:hypothetical protein